MSALSHASSKPLAILCDYDGTLVDTENIWIDVETDMMAARGVKWTREQGRELSGSNERHASEVMLAALGIPDASDAAIAELSLERSKLAAERVRALPLPWRPGAERLLETVYEAGIPCALVSASIALVLEAGVSRMKPNRFACVVDGEMVTRGKPAPDAYLLAAGRLGFAARDCLVIEDSPGGTAAGRASGAV
ncbi:MAG: HAD family phosphatase, partial [Propionibacteriaceae bacterium]|nr:HAD family phosphatase [Propionibacteriaceae bacterium]